MNTAWFLGLAADQAAPPATLSLPWWRVGVLFLIFAVLLGVWWWVNRNRLNFRSFLQQAEQKIVLREQRWINPRTVICLVEVGGESFLLAQSQGAVAWQPLGKGSAAAGTGTALAAKN